ncbi:hypothetical protein BJX99DRAFT_258090 [Aspergillus californicus]
MASGTSGTSGSWTLVPSLSLSTLLYLTLAFSSSILAQDVSLIPSAASSSFPACALSCSVLSSADDSCTPPTAAVTNRQTYVSCFCQSALLTTLQSSADGTCTDTCTSSDDRELLQQWYVNFCNSGGDTGNSDSNSDSDDDTSTTTNNNNNNSTSSSAADSTSSATANRAPPSWWDGHYQWVIMVIVLVIVFSAAAVLGVWLKRRHDAKHPHLYHAAAGASDSRVFANRSNDSPLPGPMPPSAAARPQDSVNAVSFTSISQSNVAPTQARQPLD